MPYTIPDLSETEYQALGAVLEHAELVGGFERLRVDAHRVPLAAFANQKCTVLTHGDGRAWLHTSYSAAGIDFSMHSVDLPRDAPAAVDE